MERNTDILDTYETTNKLFYKISKAPEIHIIFQDFSGILYVVFGANTCQYKSAVDHQHHEKQDLNKADKLKIQYSEQQTFVFSANHSKNFSYIACINM